MLEYPADWTAGEEADNGDGKLLYVGNPDIDIRVYANHYLEEIDSSASSQSIKYQRLKLDSGVIADLLVGYEQEMVRMEMFWVSEEDIEYHFAVTVDRDFFDENEKTLLRVAKSMKKN
ncbi:hypothetical protein [Paenibacillus massiliensis]|uniref:hypothetical protein n=1 Tax=Paenibacillus massiliensis TaxID=225917 RepID=UPI00041D0DC0|nr:hypothetical protein [Paenibacillus massiliensis]